MSHRAQAADEEAETAVEYFPASHGVHAVDDAAEEYFPASQDVHTADDEAETTVEYVPASHDVHSVDEATEEYFPAWHDVHAEEPAEEYIPMSQGMHTEGVKADTTVEYFPASQVGQDPPLKDSLPYTSISPMTMVEKSP